MAGSSQPSINDPDMARQHRQAAFLKALPNPVKLRIPSEGTKRPVRSDKHPKSTQKRV